MKEAIGGSYLFILVIIMVALFTSYVSLSANYARCYNIKDEIINAIEINGGVDDHTLKSINTYLKNIGYRSSGTCREYDAAALTFSIDKDNSNISSGKGNYCISRVKVDTPPELTGHPKTGSYYKVTVFFQLAMPVIGQLFLIPISGETSILFISLEYDHISW